MRFSAWPFALHSLSQTLQVQSTVSTLQGRYGATTRTTEHLSTACQEAEMERLLRENENRGKTPEQQIREGMTWEDVEEVKDRHGGDRKSDDFQGVNIYTLKGKSRDIIARRVGLGSGVTYEKGKEVVERIDSELRFGDYHRYAEILRTQLKELNYNSYISPTNQPVEPSEVVEEVGKFPTNQEKRKRRR